MRLAGLLINAADPQKNNLFDGYTVQIVYLVLDEAHDRTFREQSDTFVVVGTDNEFHFDLPDSNKLNLESSISVSVLNRERVEAFSGKFDLAQVIQEQRAQHPLTIRIEGAQPPKPGTPVSVNGVLVFKGSPDVTTGFGGFKVTASYNAQDAAAATFVPQATTVEMGDRNTFTIPLPDRERLKDEPVRITVKYPDGQTADEAQFGLDTLRERIWIEIDRPQVVVIGTDPRADAAQASRLKGKVVDARGETRVQNAQVILWGKKPGGDPHPILVALTDGFGNFSGDRPTDVFEAVVATVAGTKNRTLDQAVPIELVQAAGADERGATVPKFVYIVVEFDKSATSDGECACSDTAAPRRPDPEDLVNNSTAYSQDIGPNCVNFTVPNRTLEEFTYTMVVRTSEPEIKGTTLSDLDVRDLRTRPIIDAAITPGVADRAARIEGGLPRAEVAISKAMQPLPQLKAATVAKYGITDLTKASFTLAPYLADLFKTVPARGPLNTRNSVDWDSTPTFYQATTIAHGHILFYKQIWKADGYSLGDLLYSLPLAPGQKKQIVMFDWDRTEYGRRDEASHEDEALDSYLAHNRDIVDITQGSVAEQMRGGSSSETSGSAGGIGGAAGGLFGGVFAGIVGGFSASSGSASSNAWQDSSRNVSASGLNQLRDFVQQGASAVRNQRSTVVQTARQTERFRVETEVVANHNHCHAITVQYFEVLRHYAIEQKLTHVQECLFIPLLMSEFTEQKVVRWMDYLRPALRDPLSRSIFRLSTGGISFRNKPLSAGFDAIERRVNSYRGTDFPNGSYAEEEILDLSGDLTITLSLNRPKDKEDAANDFPLDEVLWLNYSFFTGWTPHFIFNNYFAKRAQQERDRIFEDEIAPNIAEGFVDTLQFWAIDKDGQAHSLPLDPTLISTYRRDTPLYVSVRPTQGQIGIRRDQIAKFVIGTSYDLTKSANSRIIVRGGSFRYRTGHFDGILFQNDAINNDLKSLTVPTPVGSATFPSDNVVVFTPLSTEELRKPKQEDEEIAYKLLRHLNANIEYYHKAIWANMDPDRRYMLLDGFLAPNAGGKSVASVVENRVIGVAGNSLIMPVAPGYKLDPSYDYEPELDDSGEPRRDDRGNIIYKQTDLLAQYQPLTPIPPFRVSVPTRGVFAEAVMGACNSCEKKDETRFWRWTEAPTGDEPTPINPIQTTPPQRTDTGDLKPSPFPTPIVNIQNAPPAPEPGSTLAGVLGLLGKSDIFPDITGLEQTQKNALQAMLSNQESAKHFADKAAEIATLAANQRKGDSTIENIKKSMDDGTLDRETGKKLIEDAYRAQISGKPANEQPANTANTSELGKAAAVAVESGREVKATQTHPDGTETTVEQKSGAGTQPGTGSGGGKESFDFTVPGEIPVIAQPKPQACWAAVATMMTAWKTQEASSRDIPTVVAKAGPEFMTAFNNGQTLGRAQKLQFVDKLGMMPDEGNFQSHDFDFYLGKMKDFGPLWVTVDASDKELALHAKILYGMRGDGTPAGTFLRIIDPNGGKRYEITFEQFLDEYESVVRETPADEPLFVQIVRFKDLVKNGGGEGHAVTVEAFAHAAYQEFAGNGDLQSALTQAHANVLAAGGLGPRAHVPFSLIALASDGNHRYAGILDDEQDFSGSLMKVAAMYAAFELRAAALRFAKSKNFANEDQYFNEMGKEFDPQIKATAVADVRKVGIGLAPAYKNILKPSGLDTPTPAVVFTDDFKNTLYQSIAKSHNPSSAVIIQRVGYSYINAALMKAGLYDSGTQKGIWLAGDYAGGAQARIPAANDGTTALGTTTKQMARFFALLELKKLAGSDESKDMQDLVRATITENEPAWTSRSSKGNFDLEYGKIGVAGLGRKQEGPQVYSDGLVVTWRGDAAKLTAKKLTGKIAICWQNLRAKEFNPPFDGVAEIVNKAYAKILT